MGDTFREQGRTVHLQELFLDHAPHQVGNVHLVHPVAETPREPVLVEESHEKLEVLVLSVVRRGGHQQKMPRGSG